MDIENEGFIDVDKLVPILEVLAKKNNPEDCKIYQNQPLAEAAKSFLEAFSTSPRLDVREPEMLSVLTNRPTCPQMKLMDSILSCPEVYKMRLSKFSVTLFLHNQNLLSHECTHHTYMRDFIAAIEEKEIEFEKAKLLQKKYKNIVASD